MTSLPSDGPVLSTSPTSIRGPSPVRRRGDRDTSSQTESISIDPTIRPHRSPTLTRSFDPNDPDARERQRTMDVDMALHLSLARRETIVSPPSPYDGPRPETEPPFGSLSVAEQHDIELARGDGHHSLDHTVVNGAPDVTTHTSRPATPLHLRLQHLSQTQDPSLMAAIESQYPLSNHEDASASMAGLPTYQANSSRSVFDFSALENFAAEEKANLGLTWPSNGQTFKLRYPSTSRVSEAGQPISPPLVGATASELAGDSAVVPPRPGARQRKLSQSSPVPRPNRRGIRGKMALFEHHANEPAPGFPARLMGNGQLSAIPSSEDVSASGNQYASAPLGTGIGGIISPGHDRPYRFSFYSNALSATIHARSLCELPAEGESFEDLFSGLPSPTARQGETTGGPPPFAVPIPVPHSRSGTSIQNGQRTPGSSEFAPGSQTNGYFGRPGEKIGFDPGRPNGPGASDNSEANTWWLDVQSPTDEEMKALSKVFSIHPLTTEDIQMEEAREKIELFRNYYLVCFRSFDQDPYSPTHLEPLNMYIIVFREGILSFHFRPTPHPQNVRRRIKQLKDYINVTSDWISYALIDDITDAFGPLIQSIEYEVDSIDELVLILKEAEQSDMLRRIGTCRKKVMGLLRLMGNKADVVKGLAKRCNENWRVAPTSDIGLYLSDIQDHLITMTQNLNHYEKILSRSHSNYLAQISIEMTDANNQINDVLSKLTALGTILIPMNLITGLWGMNVHVPGQDIEDGYAWFASIVAALAAFALIGGYTTYQFMIRR
ncbi:cora-domain-containing protein [Gyrodon lividus]|nr:cora-domain-containing protein [Gyrodon lividus]